MEYELGDNEINDIQIAMIMNIVEIDGWIKVNSLYNSRLWI